MMTRFLAALLLCFGLLSLSLAARDEAPTDQGAASRSQSAVAYQYDSTMRFGLKVIKDAAGKPIDKELTYDRAGGTNNTVAQIDGKQVPLHPPFEIDKTKPKFKDKDKWTEKNANATAEFQGTQASRSVWSDHGVRIQSTPGDHPKQATGGCRRSAETILRHTARALRSGKHRRQGAQRRHPRDDRYANRRQRQCAVYRSRHRLDRHHERVQDCTGSARIHRGAGKTKPQGSGYGWPHDAENDGRNRSRRAAFCSLIGQVQTLLGKWP